jgi:hypothetical protein
VTHSPAEIIAKWLVDKTYALDPPSQPWCVYVGSMPEDGNSVLCVYDTTGIMQGRIQRTGETIQSHGLQVRVRSQGYSAGRAKADTLCTNFDELRREEVTLDDIDYLIHAVSRVTPIIHLGPEAGNKRERFTINFLATITESP